MQLACRFRAASSRAGSNWVARRSLTSRTRVSPASVPAAHRSAAATSAAPSIGPSAKLWVISSAAPKKATVSDMLRRRDSSSLTVSSVLIERSTRISHMGAMLTHLSPPSNPGSDPAQLPRSCWLRRSWALLVTVTAHPQWTQ